VGKYIFSKDVSLQFLDLIDVGTKKEELMAI
jgi:hypothetical protein